MRLSPHLAGVPLQFMEYGTLTNSEGRVSEEPGCFGGAWKLASSVQAASRGLSRAFHWGIDDGIGREGRRLFYSSAFVPAAARKLFGDLPAATILTSVSDTTETLPEVQSECGRISVSGVGAVLPAGTARNLSTLSAMVSSPTVGMLVSVFAINKSCHDPVNVSVTFVLPPHGNHLQATRELSVWTMVLDADSSPFEALRREAAAMGWLKYDDGLMYGIGDLLSAEGKTALHRNASRYLDMQTRLFTPSPVEDGSVVTQCGATRQDGTPCTVNFISQAPVVRALWLTPM